MARPVWFHDHDTHVTVLPSRALDGWLAAAPSMRNK